MTTEIPATVGSISIEASGQDAGSATQDASNPPSSARRSTPAAKAIDWLRGEIVSGSATIVAFIILLGPIYGILLGSRFLNTNARIFDLYQSGPVLLMSVGIVVPLACGQFDLSVGPLATLSAFMTIGLTVSQGLPLWASIVVALLVGVVAGAINGFLVVRLRINAFIATLGSSGVIAGIYTVYSSGKTITPSTTKGPSASSFKDFTKFGGFQDKAPAVLVWILIAVLLAASLVSIGDRWPLFQQSGRVLTVSLFAIYAAVIVALAIAGVPAQVSWSILVILTVAFFVWVLLRLTSHGRALYAIGGSPNAASLAGIPIYRYMFSAFMISGFIAALSGVLLAASQGTAVPGIADSFLLPAYAAAFLSTVILSAGRFHVWGALTGGLFIVWVAQGLVLGGISYTWTDVVNGLVLVGAVAFSTSLRRQQH